MTYEELQTQYHDLNIVEIDLSEVKGLKGLCIGSDIAIKQKMTQTEKSCVLAEELGHYYTTVGDILDQSSVENRKLELRARLWAYNKMIGLFGIIRAYERGCRSASEMAEYLNVTVEFLHDAISQYRSKYGVCVEVDNYIIFFMPNLAVMERISD